jgi:outer membrane protein assembly factor BamB
VNAETSELIWSYTTGNMVFSSPAVANGVVYEGANDGKLYAVNALTGALLWDYKFPGIVFSSPAVVDGKVYVGNFQTSTIGGFSCLDAATGALVWNYSTGGVYSSPAVADGKVYVGSTDATVYCFDAATGMLIWNYVTEDSVWSSPAVANGVVYIGGPQVFAFGAWEPIPEGLTIGVMLILSTIAVAVSARYFNKRRKWENW